MKKIFAILFVLIITIVIGCLTSDSGKNDGEDTDTTHTVSGSITDHSGTGLSGVTVTLAGGSSNLTVTTDSTGYYSFQNISNGTYTVTPSKPEFIFTPLSSQVVVENANKMVDNFTGTAETANDGGDFSIFGRILDRSGAAIPDVNVILAGTDKSVTADKEGNYYFGHIENGTYTILPSLEGYRFSPRSAEIAIIDADIRTDFTGSLIVEGGYTVSGTIVDFSGNGVSGIELSLTGNTNRYTAITDAQGNYTFVNVPDASYGLLPISGEYTFTPEYRTVFVNGTNITVDNFIASAGGSEGTYSITGRILDDSGNAIPDALIMLDYQDKITSADKEGNYFFGNLGDGDYKITPSITGYAFSPPVKTVTISGENVRVDFTGVLGGEGHAVSGRIIDQSGNGVPGIDLSFTSVTDRFTAETDNDGYYIFTDIPNAVYGLLPLSERYLFSPTFQNIVVNGSDITTDNFIATDIYAEHSISGRILDNSGNGIPDVTISIPEKNMTGMTDKEGNYYFGNIKDGTCTLIPSKDGYVFSPPSKTIIVAGSDIRADFTGSPGGSGDGRYSISGRVLDENGNGLADITVMLIMQKISVQTDKEGNYFFGNIEDGIYFVSAVMKGLVFEPEVHVINIDGADVRAPDFILSSGGQDDNTYKILGIVADNQGNVLADVTVVLAGTDKTTQSDKEGNFYFGNIPNGDYTVIPSLENYTFSPESRVVKVDGTDVFVEPFLGTKGGGGTGEGQYTISGVVVDAEGNGISGVTMTLGGEDGDLTTLSDKDGKFKFINIENGDYMLFPMLIGMAFSPTAQSVVVRGGDVTVNFTTMSGSDDKFYNVSGKIRDESGSGIPDVKLSLSGPDGIVDTMTDSDGAYEFPSVKSNIYLLTPVKEGYTFSPKFQQLTVVGGDITFNFIGYPEGGEVAQISGRVVTEAGKGISDIDITIQSIDLENKVVGITSTDLDGRYMFDDLWPGIFTITPQREDFTFDPPSITVTVDKASFTADDIVGTRSKPIDINSASATISTNGGTISVMNGLGDEITLEIPPLAILGSELITLTTLDEPPENPIEENIFPGVTIEPEGLLLNGTAILRITLAETRGDLNACTIFWSVDPEYVIPLGNQDHSYDSIQGEIYHFSAYSAGKATINEISGQIDKARLYGHPSEKIAASAATNYGWQITYTNILGLLHWADRSMALGMDSEAKKAIDEAKKVVEEDAEVFADEVIPPVNPCEDKEYIQALDKYYTVLVTLGAGESTAYDKISNVYKQIYDQCRVRITIDADYKQTLKADDVTDEFICQGTITVYAPLFGGKTDEFGELTGGGTLMLTGSGSSEDCSWTKAGNVDIEVSGQLQWNDDWNNYDMKITLTEKWIYTQTNICDDQTWSQNFTLTPEPATFTMPVQDGFILDHTMTEQNVVTHLKYVVHIPQSK